MNASDELRNIVESVTPRLEQMAGAEVTDRPASGEWSKTEILGHLTDSDRLRREQPPSLRQGTADESAE